MFRTAQHISRITGYCGPNATNLAKIDTAGRKVSNDVTDLKIFGRALSEKVSLGRKSPFPEPFNIYPELFNILPETTRYCGPNATKSHNIQRCHGFVC
jgi:hypothetical protein